MLFLNVLYPIFSEENGNFQYFSSKNAYILKIIRVIGLVFYHFNFLPDIHGLGTLKHIESCYKNAPSIQSLLFFKWNYFLLGIFCLNKFWCNIVISCKIIGTDLYLLNIRPSLFSASIINY